MKTFFIKEPLVYDGAQLANHWIYKNFGLLGDAVVAFAGNCDVDLDSMVDLEDVRNEDFIYSEKMLHFVIEVFGIPLEEGVILQRLFTCIIQDKLNELCGKSTLRRMGDDLFFETKKLSVSICTVSPTSILIHTGLNIDATGAPVDAAGLIADLGIENIEALAVSCMRTLSEEWTDIKRSICKVRAVN